MLVAAIAAVSPVIAELTRRIGIPDVVIEILLGIMVGPYVLKLAHPDSVVNGFSQMGLAFLMFLAGFELDLLRIRGRPLKLAAVGWVASVVLGLAFASLRLNRPGPRHAHRGTGVDHDGARHAGADHSTTPGSCTPGSGRTWWASGRTGSWAPSSRWRCSSPSRTRAGAELAVDRLGDHRRRSRRVFLPPGARPPKVTSLLRRNLYSSSQLPVRVSVLTRPVARLPRLPARASTCSSVRSPTGIVVRLFTSGDDSEVGSRAKLDAVGFGFLIPIFFVVSGIHFDLHILLHRLSCSQPPCVGLPGHHAVRPGHAGDALVPADHVSRAERGATWRWFSATGLPLIVVITTIGRTSEGRMLPENAAALVGAGMLSVLLFPVIGLRGLRRAGVVDEGSAIERPIVGDEL